MRTNRLIAVVLAVLVVSAVTVGAEKGSETLHASCLVKVTSDPSIIQIDETIIDYLIQSSGVAGRAREEVLQIPQDNMGDCFSIFIEPLAINTKPRVRTATTRRTPTSRTSTTTGPARTTPSRTSTSSSQKMGGMMMPGEGMGGMMPGIPSGGMGGMGGMGGGMMGGSSSSPKPTTTSKSRSSSSGGSFGGRVGGGSSGSMGMGGMGYGGGMGGGMGGMMGGGMGGYGGATTRPATSTRSTVVRAVSGDDEQTLLFKIEVDLTDCDKDAAEEFLAAVVDNLREALDHAFMKRAEQLEFQLQQARGQRARFIELIDEAAGKTAEDRAIEKMLAETKVDLSKLNNEMPIVDAIDLVRKSVDPPLKLVVMWTDLSNSAFIEQDTAIGIGGEGLYNVSVGAGLEKILLGVSGGLSDISYCIKDGVINVSTWETLPEINDYKAMKERTNIRGSEVPVDILISQKQRWLQELFSIKMELSRIQARSRAIEKQLPKLEKNVQVQVASDPVTMNIESIIEGLETRLAAMKQRVDSGVADVGSLIEIQEKVSRAQIELAKRKQELGEIGGGSRIREFSSELIELAIQIEEGETMKSAIDTQLSWLEGDIERAESLNHQAQQNRQGAYEMEQIEQRIVDLESEITTLAQPSVTVIGGK